MGRHRFWGYAVDAMGNVVPNASVSIYLSGTNTPAKVYPTRDSTTPITEAPQITCDDSGFFEFWVDDSDYPPTQLFDIVVEKNGVLIAKITNEPIIRPYEHGKLLDLLPEGLDRYYHLSEDQYNTLTQGNDASMLHHHDSLYYRKDVIDSWELIKNYTLERDLNANNHAIENVETLEATNVIAMTVTSMNTEVKNFNNPRYTTRLVPIPPGEPQRGVAIEAYDEDTGDRVTMVDIWYDDQNKVAKMYINGYGYVFRVDESNRSSIVNIDYLESRLSQALEDVMTKSEYDKNMNGKVDIAEVAEAIGDLTADDLKINVIKDSTLYSEPPSYLEIDISKQAVLVRDPNNPNTWVVVIGDGVGKVFYAEHVGTVNGAEGGRIVGDVTIDGFLDVTKSANIRGRLGTLGYDPDAGYPTGWGGGVHTWDVYAEGSVGLGRDGKLITWVWHDPNNGARVNLRDADERDRILLYVNPNESDTKIEMKDRNGNTRWVAFDHGELWVGFDLKMARTVEGDFKWKRALVVFPSMLHVNYERDFECGVKIWGPLLGGIALDGFTRGYTVINEIHSCTSDENEYCVAYDADIKGNFMIVTDRIRVRKVRVYIDYKYYEIDVHDPLWMPIIVAPYRHLKVEIAGMQGDKFVRIFGLKW